MNLSDMPKDCDWTIYSASAPEYKPRCVLMSKDRKSYISETGDTVLQAISQALKKWETK